MNTDGMLTPQASHVNHCVGTVIVLSADPYIHIKDFVKIWTMKTVAIADEPTLPHQSFIVLIFKVH
jgi:hypothetical protein